MICDVQQVTRSCKAKQTVKSYSWLAEDQEEIKKKNKNSTLVLIICLTITHCEAHIFSLYKKALTEKALNKLVTRWADSNSSFILLWIVTPDVVFYRCLGCSGPSPYIPCAQRGAVNCSRTRPELSGLLPSCAAPAASFFLKQKRLVEAKCLRHLFELILLIIKFSTGCGGYCTLNNETHLLYIFILHTFNQTL